MQQEDNSLNSLFEAQIVEKKELRAFKPVVQTSHMYMHHVDTLADAEWNSFNSSKMKEFNLGETQQFVTEDSLFARKWQDKLGKFQEVKEKVLELVLDLGTGMILRMEINFKM
jgi:hypothetical protein